ncbi:hypothetical protein [Sinimarinibacterium sp. NLF-5-8]|uniref:hypothetical protein n=1 Tax=Sinimarinibacterium sp. NLF-5-8 TaxID=2698684 RepID=UPI00137C23AD|nr:hypothetical protein [Sinimarinibacterium sp. NLF-5-8]QHS09036.1 hypothetical protein GT972_02010 [Sinimarinibacterium sp. NLF-5-8]
MSEKANPLLTEAIQLLLDFLSIVDDSSGVSGYHLNGDIAEWGEFETVDAAVALLERYEQEYPKEAPSPDAAAMSGHVTQGFSSATDENDWLDELDRRTGERWRTNSSLEEWFPYTKLEMDRLSDEVKMLRSALKECEIALERQRQIDAPLPVCVKALATARAALRLDGKVLPDSI